MPVMIGVNNIVHSDREDIPVQVLQIAFGIVRQGPNTPRLTSSDIAESCLLHS